MFNKFQTYKTLTKTYTRNKIKCLQNDNGGDYL